MSTIGATLRSTRESRGVTIPETSAATRIRPSFLEALEDEQFDRLGGNVYAKGFLRSYATYLGLDPAPLIDEYRASEVPAGPVFPQVRRPVQGPPGERHRTNWMVLGSVCASILLVAGAFSLIRGRPASPEPATSAKPRATTPVVTATTPKPAQKPAPITGVKVALTVNERSWTEVSVDGKVAYAGLLPAGEHRSFSGKQRVALVLGNAGGVQVAVNGKPVAVPTTSGAVWQKTFNAKTASRSG